jgi:hypothetical protein
MRDKKMKEWDIFKIVSENEYKFVKSDTGYDWSLEIEMEELGEGFKAFITDEPFMNYTV